MLPTMFYTKSMILLNALHLDNMITSSMITGSYALANYAPNVWNSIPLSVRQPVSLTFQT